MVGLPGGRVLGERVGDARGRCPRQRARPARASRARGGTTPRSRPSRRRGRRRRTRRRSAGSSSNASPSSSSAHSLDARLLDVALPRLHLGRVVLEREDAPAQIADACGEPDRGVAARAAELEHLAVGLRRDEREEEAAGRRLDLPRALLRREPCSRSAASSRSRRSRTAFTRSSSMAGTYLGAVRAELTIEIARTPEDVFAYLTDVSNLPAWQAGYAPPREGTGSRRRARCSGASSTRRSRSSRASRACSR